MDGLLIQKNWWKKSCTTKRIVETPYNRYWDEPPFSTGARFFFIFLPSTVWRITPLPPFPTIGNKCRANSPKPTSSMVPNVQKRHTCTCGPDRPDHCYSLQTPTLQQSNIEISWNPNWLVVGPPLWKIWKSIGMISNPIYGKIELMFQTTNQYWNPNNHSWFSQSQLHL